MMNDSNENRYSLSRQNTLNFFYNFLRETLFLTPTIKLNISISSMNIFVLSVEFPQKITQ